MPVIRKDESLTIPINPEMVFLNCLYIIILPYAR